MSVQQIAEKASPWRAPRVGDFVMIHYAPQRRDFAGTINRLYEDADGRVTAVDLRVRGTRIVRESMPLDGLAFLHGSDPEPPPACPDCKGSGTYWWKRCGCAHGCGLCEGTGHCGAFGCPTCHGSGNALTLDADYAQLMGGASR